jgi:DUF1365 family protein
MGKRQEPRPLVSAAIVTAATSLRVTTLIHWQGVRLFLRGLRVEPRPIHAQRPTQAEPLNQPQQEAVR